MSTTERTPGGNAFHYVCTQEQARALIEGLDRFWVSNCGCREEHGDCARSRIDLCLLFRPDVAGSSENGRRELSLADVKAILAEAEDKLLVPRPFRDEATLSVTEGICFCCDDCCTYFVADDEPCDRGTMVAQLDSEECLACGACVDACFFHARAHSAQDELTVDLELCYGCGVCRLPCPSDCITMIPRAALAPEKSPIT